MDRGFMFYFVDVDSLVLHTPAKRYYKNTTKKQSGIVIYCYKMEAF